MFSPARVLSLGVVVLSSLCDCALTQAAEPAHATVQIGYMNTDPKGLRVSFSLWADGRSTQRNPFRPLSDDEILKHVRGTGALPGKGAVMVCLESPDMTLSKLLAAVARLDAIVTRAGGRADNVEIILIPPPLPAKTDPGDQLPQKRSRPDEKP